jgi:hypothetical protein
MPAVPKAPAPPPLLGQDAAKKKPKPKSQQPSFLGTEADLGVPNQSGKTLLGQ